MRRLPFWPTLLVAAACAIMIALGIWQLQRARWKDGLLRDYAAAHTAPPMAYPTLPDPKALPLFRKANAMCQRVTGWRATSGRNAKGDSGWIHIADCATGVEGPGLAVVAGWNRTPGNPAWSGGEVAGVIAQDPQRLIRLVSDAPLAPGLEAAAAPSIAEIPNNHLGYAVQWFLFAGAAALIYGLALRRRATRA